jgi:hypothetical protein
MRSTRKTRLANLEGHVGFDDATLRFADGSTRTVKLPRQRQKKLELLIAALDRASLADHPEIEQAPTKFDGALDLLGRVESIEPGNRLLELVMDLSKQAAVEREQSRAASDATPEGPTAQGADV